MQKSVRHSFATELVVDGADMDTVAKLRGHAYSTIGMNALPVRYGQTKMYGWIACQAYHICPMPSAQKLKGLL